MKRLAILNNSLIRGGSERCTVYLSEYFSNKGILTLIITVEEKEDEYDIPEGVTRICLTKEKIERFTIVKRLNNLIFRLKQLRTVVRKNNIDTVLVMAKSLSTYAILSCMGLKVKVIISERNDPKNSNWQGIKKVVREFIMKFANGFVFQTEDAKKYYDNKFKNNGVVIPNPLFSENLPEPYIGEREKIIVSVGRLVNQKNQKILIEAFSKIASEYPEYKLVIYGEGDLRSELENQIKELYMEKRILLPGNVTNVLEEIYKASVFVMTSNFEGMPNALIEAMALGIPCISTDCPCGGPKSLIDDGENGILFEVGNVDELIIKLKLLLDDRELADTIGKSAVNIRNKLNVDTVGEKWLNYLTKI